MFSEVEKLKFKENRFELKFFILFITFGFKNCNFFENKKSIFCIYIKPTKTLKVIRPYKNYLLMRCSPLKAIQKSPLKKKKSIKSYEDYFPYIIIYRKHLAAFFYFFPFFADF